jgi:PhnB protein
MQTRLNPYLSFNGNAQEAMEFYHGIFGGNLVLNTFGEAQMPAEMADADKIMHAMLEAENGITFMASDTPKGVETTKGTAFSMSLSGDNESELRSYWDKLSQGGTVREPLVKAPWGDTFGMLTDKYGIEWMVNISGTKE